MRLAPSLYQSEIQVKSAKELRTMSGVGKVVCVTGGSGYVASWLVKLLLQRGYTVRATVRDPQNPEKTLHLRTLEGAPERLHLFKAELLEEGAFDAVVDGCEGIFHTASPFVVDVTDPEAGLIEPAVKGTLNVLSSCAKASSVKRVVVTSSLAAVLFTGRPVAPDVVVDETWFSNPELCRSMKNWYVLSKTLAEEAAWNFSKEKGLDMVSVNPGMVMGPLLQPTLNTSAGAILKLINGSSTFYNATFGWVDVRDVALAHILAYEISSASGRYCVTEKVAHYSDLAEILRKLYPNLSIPQKCADDNPQEPKYQVSTERAKSLGVQFTPLEVSLKDTVESLKEKNFVNF